MDTGTGTHAVFSGELRDGTGEELPGQRTLRRTGFAGMRSLPEGWMLEGHTREYFLDLQPYNLLEFRVRPRPLFFPTFVSLPPFPRGGRFGELDQWRRRRQRRDGGRFAVPSGCRRAGTSVRMDTHGRSESCLSVRQHATWGAWEFCVEFVSSYVRRQASICSPLHWSVLRSVGLALCVTVATLLLPAGTEVDRR